MAECELFEVAAERLEHHTSLDRLEARGTLRLALKAAGLEPKRFTLEQLEVVFQRVMPAELGKRGEADAPTRCSAVMRDLKSVAASGEAPDAPDPDGVFRRLGS